MECSVKFRDFGSNSNIRIGTAPFFVFETIVGDFFNIFNRTKVRLPNQNNQLNNGIPNVDFLKPQLFYLPFNMRLGLRLEF